MNYRPYRTEPESEVLIADFHRVKYRSSRGRALGQAGEEHQKCPSHFFRDPHHDILRRRGFSLARLIAARDNESGNDGPRTDLIRGN